MLYITASTGIFSYNPDSEKIEHVISNKNRAGFFSKKSHGFFGICHQISSQKIIVVSREKLGTKSAGKPTTDIGLHYINPKTNSYQTINYVKDIHDVHQIDVYGDTVLLTDTGKNRIIAYNLVTDTVHCKIHFGHIRDDVHHINAVTVISDQILIGMNNSGKSSDILHLPLTLLDSGSDVIDAFEHAPTITNLGPYTNTHDIEPFNDSFLVCSSHDSVVLDSKTVKPVIRSNNWVRGIAQDEKHIWVGQSHHAKRAKRHSKHLDGSILKINSKTMEIENIISIPGTGQINDLQYINI